MRPVHLFRKLSFMNKNITLAHPAAWLMALLAVVASVYSSRAQSWTPSSAPSRTWYGIAGSAAGDRLVAVASGTGIYLSANSGGTWTLSSAPAKNWRAVATSANGSNLLAVASFGGVYTSTNAGTTWISNSVAANHDWSTAASSGDGTKLAVGGTTFGNIYTSTNAGASWVSNSPPSGYWTSVVSSADGTRLAAAWSGVIYNSTNSSTNWTSHTPPAGGTSLAISADGTLLVMPYSPAAVYCSTNWGTTWAQRSVPNGGTGNGAALSANGSRLAAFGKLYTTTNGGVTWTADNAAGMNWTAVTLSADGGKAAIAVNGGGIYTYYAAPTPQVNFSRASNQITCAWLIPSTNFVLQQSADLISWSSVTNTPALNSSNLNNTLTFSPTNTSGFYRLATP